MVYTDKSPVLNDIEWRDNSQFPVIRKGETPSDWMKRIWDQLVIYRNNNKLTDCHKWYLIARKMKYLWEGDLGHSVKVNIAICHSCDQLVYVDQKSNSYHNYKMVEHWRSQCIENKFCEMSFEEYMELKDKPKDNINYFTKIAFDQYEMWLNNAIKRVKHVREMAKKIRAVNIISQKWLEYMYRPEGMTAKQLAQHYQLLWAVRKEMRQVNN
ncbi:42299_t:CDS:1, partial [Gigaspora margarita]